MRLRDALDSVSGLRFVVDHTPILSAVGRRYLYASEWIDSEETLNALYDDLDIVSSFIGSGKSEDIAEVDHLISQIRDIESTIDGLMGGMILGDVEFFEIKAFALIIERLRPLAERLQLAELPSLMQVVDLLDPEHTRVSAFHIYDLYSQELAQVRAKLKKNQSDQSLTSSEESDEAASLYQYSLLLEDGVRKDLAFQLRPLARSMRQALRTVARMDILQAKVRVADKLNLVKPCISLYATKYKALVNPQIADILCQRGKKYQPIDIDFASEPTLISGINMGGKTVCLKTLALAQTLCQFGFYVPAEIAEVALVRRVMLVVDDNQSELSGLSSFAGEMRQVDEIIKVIREDANVLVLIDELARTTNPVEGRAIVEAMLEELSRRGVRSFVSSHYDNIRTGARRLRVKGLRDDVNLSEIDVRKIDRYIDYGLIPDESGDVPHEALRIARLIGIDEEFVSSAEARI